MEKLEKSEIRRRVKESRLALNKARKTMWDEAICQKVLSMPEIRQAFCVYCYISFYNEAGTGKLIKSLLEMGKYVAVPKVAGKHLDFYAIRGKKDLEEGVMGIMEPKSSCLKIYDGDAPVIVPGIAFDLEGHRVGYGGGYYDRFFESEPGHPRFGIAYDFQIFEKNQIPAEPHDKGMDLVITP